MEECARCGETAAGMGFETSGDVEADSFFICPSCMATAVIVLNGLELGMSMKQLRRIAKADVSVGFPDATT